MKERANPLGLGGWSRPHPISGKSHFFRTFSASATPMEAPMCGAYDFHTQRLNDDLSNVDPLAPENCRECRRLLLLYLGLITNGPETATP